jgi:hypothetical protein
MGKKTDNHAPAGKLALRRYFLQKYHADGQARVLDCCQATGFLWKTLRAEKPGLASYLGVDLVPQRGRLMIDSARMLDQPGWTQNVIDVDTYGSPWTHWLAILRHARHDLTVFLTIGHVQNKGGGTVPAPMRQILGLTFQRAREPRGLAARIIAFGLPHMLAHARACGFTLAEILESPPGAHARYLGIRLVRAA